MSFDSDEDDVPQVILEKAGIVSLNLLPVKSRERYEKEYTIFQNWMSTNRVRKITEESVLVYFSDRAKALKPSSIWSKYSMLRSCINVKENIDIKYPKVIAFLKRQSSGYKPKKSLTFDREEINRFLGEAPDEHYLHMKVWDLDFGSDKNTNNQFFLKFRDTFRLTVY